MKEVIYFGASSCCFLQPVNADIQCFFLQDQRCSICQASQAFLLLTLWPHTLHGGCMASLARRGTYHHYSFVLRKPARCSSGKCGAGEHYHLVQYQSCMACSHAPLGSGRHVGTRLPARKTANLQTLLTIVSPAAAKLKLPLFTGRAKQR